MHVTSRSIAFAAASALTLAFASQTASAQTVQVQVSPYQPQQPVYVQQVAPPPPPEAQAGNGQYVAPLQQQTQQTYVPQSVALSGPRIIRDWHEGEPIPPGYHPSTRIRGGLVGGGLGLFGGTYAISLIVAAVGQDSCSYSGCTNSAAPLFIPVVGPFVTMGNTDSATADVFLVLDGLAQAGGLAMFIYGLAVPKTVLVRNDLGMFKNVTAAPLVGRGVTGLSLSAQF